MKVQNGTWNGKEAVRYSGRGYDTAVYYKVAGHWYRAIGQEDQFILN